MNLQNIPRENKTVKRSFVPKLDCFLFADYSSIEYRLLAYYAANMGFPTLANEFKNGLDPHTETAKLILEVDEVNEAGRQVGKTFNYSSLYLGGTPTIMKQLKIDYREARNLLDKFHEARPEIGMLDKYIRATLEGRGYVKTIAGRRLHPLQPRLALNAVIQGSAAELMRDSLRKCHSFLSNPSVRSHMVVSVHDEIGFDCHQDEVIWLAKALPNLMGNAKIEPTVPIEIDVSYSETTWGDKEEMILDG